MSEEYYSESEFYYPEEIEHDEGHVSDSDNNEVSAESNSQDEINAFINEQKSANTIKKTRSDMNVFDRYMKSIGKENVNIENLPLPELDHFLSKFFMNVRKVNGDEYEPDTISGYKRSIQRYLSDQHCTLINILKAVQGCPRLLKKQESRETALKYQTTL